MLVLVLYGKFCNCVRGLNCCIVVSIRNARVCEQNSYGRTVFYFLKTSYVAAAVKLNEQVKLTKKTSAIGGA